MFAVIRTGGKQYRVQPDDVIQFEKLDGDAGQMIEFGEVLMVGDGEKATVGAPHVAGALVTGEVVEQGRGRKVIAFKKRRRKNSQRTRGHRQALTSVRISEILTDGAKPSKKAAGKPKAAPADEKPAAAPKKTAAPAKAEAKAPAPEKAESKAAEKKPATPSAGEGGSAPLFTAPSGKGDDLTKIKGIGPVAKKQLNEQGITQFSQLAKLGDKDIARIDEAMPFSADQISDWRDQAAKLAK